MVNPAPGFIHYKSGFCSGPAPDFVLVRLRILSIFQSVSESGIFQASRVRAVSGLIHFESGSGFYKACPGPRPDSTNSPFSMDVHR